MKQEPALLEPLESGIPQHRRGRRATRLLIKSLACTLTLGVVSCTHSIPRIGLEDFSLVNHIRALVQEDLISPLLAAVNLEEEEEENQEETEKENQWENQVDFSSFGRPGEREIAASRGYCAPGEPPLTALLPTSNWGKTRKKRPTFWFYVPYSSQEVTSGEFVLLDKEWNVISLIIFKLPERPGLVSLTLPTTVPELEINKEYRWFFKLFCDSDNPMFVRGWVQRIELSPSLNQQLNASIRRKYRIYASQGIWYDALADLAEGRLKNYPEATLAEWTKLLGAKGVGLEQLKEKPIVGSVLLNPSQPITDENVRSPKIGQTPL